MTSKLPSDLHPDNFLDVKFGSVLKGTYKVGEEEAPICKRLVEKHGDDYEKMFWDVKVNIFQWTKVQTQKKVEAWKAGNVRSMAAEILSGHGMDLRRPLYGAAKKRNEFGH